MGKKWRTRKIKNKNKSKSGKRAKTMRKKYGQRGGVFPFRSYKPTIQEIVDYAIKFTTNLSLKIVRLQSGLNKFNGPTHVKDIKISNINNNTIIFEDDNTSYEYEIKDNKIHMIDILKNGDYKDLYAEFIDDETYQTVITGLTEQNAIKKETIANAKKNEKDEIDKRKKELANPFKVYVVNLKNIFSDNDDIDESELYNNAELQKLKNLLEQYGYDADKTNIHKFIEEVETNINNMPENSDTPKIPNEDLKNMKMQIKIFISKISIFSREDVTKLKDIKIKIPKPESQQGGSGIFDFESIFNNDDELFNRFTNKIINADYNNFIFFMRSIKSRYEKKYTAVEDLDTTNYKSFKKIIEESKMPFEINGQDFSINAILLFVSKDEDNVSDATANFDNYLGCAFYEPSKEPIFFDRPYIKEGLFNKKTGNYDKTSENILKTLIGEKINEMEKEKVEPSESSALSYLKESGSSLSSKMKNGFGEMNTTFLSNASNASKKFSGLSSKFSGSLSNGISNVNKKISGLSKPSETPILLQDVNNNNVELTKTYLTEILKILDKTT